MKRNKKTVLYSILIFFIFYHFLINLLLNINYPEKNDVDNTKYILFWTKFFGENDWEGFFREGINLKDFDCPVTNCEFLFDRIHHNKSDALVFHASDFNVNDIPVIRNQEQIYIWFNLEAPSKYINFYLLFF